MSRIGKMPIQVPSGTKVEIADGVFTAQGPKGKVAQTLFDGYPVKVDGSVVSIERPGDTGPERSRHGLLRALLANAVQGVSAGFVKQLDIVGVRRDQFLELFFGDHLFERNKRHLVTKTLAEVGGNVVIQRLIDSGKDAAL